MATENDIVLVYLEDSPVFFARVEAIWPDVKKNWFNIELMVLQIPVKSIVWTLKDIYIEGTEFFMGGKKMRIEVVRAPRAQSEVDEDRETALSESSSNTIGSENQFRNRRQSKSDQGENRLPEKSHSRREDIGQVVSLADFQKRKRDSQ